jgi:threonine dehydratase
MSSLCRPILAVMKSKGKKSRSDHFAFRTSMSTSDTTAPSQLVSLDAIIDAHKRVLPFIHRTPLLTSTTLDAIATERLQKGTNERLRIRLAFKSEHLQVVGAFKIRGATNAVLTHLKRLKDSHGGHFDPAKLCLVTHSSGNHAAAVACAARQVGASAAVVMPRTAPQIKKAAVANYGARIVECEPTQQARESTAQALKDEIEADDSGTIVRFIHPYDEDLVIAGQGTMGLEIVQQAQQLGSGSKRSCSAAQDNVRVEDNKAWASRDPDREPPLDFVVAPVGGGGMLSGVSTAIRGVDDRIIVIGAEPKGESCNPMLACNLR